MKKIILTALILSLSISSSFAFNCKKDDTSQIKAILNGHNKALKEHNINKIKTFYSSSYKSADGFNINDLSKMLEKTYSAYENIKYDTKINSITTFDDWAIAQVTDKTSAKLYADNKSKDKNEIGVLQGKSAYNIYLKKDENGWKIVYDDILMEETSLKYGIANDINMNLTTPVFVNKGQSYDLSLKIDKPDDIIAIGAISTEEIVYPPDEYQEKFRKISSTGGLERVVKANTNNLDEYAIASVGFTRVSINEDETKARIQVLGMAYLMKRINVVEPKKNPQRLVENN